MIIKNRLKWLLDPNLIITFKYLTVQVEEWIPASILNSHWIEDEYCPRKLIYYQCQLMRVFLELDRKFQCLNLLILKSSCSHSRKIQFCFFLLLKGLLNIAITFISFELFFLLFLFGFSFGANYLLRIFIFNFSIVVMKLNSMSW